MKVMYCLIKVFKKKEDEVSKNKKMVILIKKTIQ